MGLAALTDSKKPNISIVPLKRSLDAVGPSNASSLGHHLLQTSMISKISLNLFTEQQGLCLASFEYPCPSAQTSPVAVCLSRQAKAGGTTLSLPSL